MYPSEQELVVNLIADADVLPVNHVRFNPHPTIYRLDVAHRAGGFPPGHRRFGDGEFLPTVAASRCPDALFVLCTQEDVLLLENLLLAVILQVFRVRREHSHVPLHQGDKIIFCPFHLLAGLSIDEVVHFLYAGFALVPVLLEEVVTYAICFRYSFYAWTVISTASGYRISATPCALYHSVN